MEYFYRNVFMRNATSAEFSSYSKLFIGCFTFILFTVSACRKADIEISSSDYNETISTYLESQKFDSKNPSAAVAQANKNIDLLKNNLDFSSAKTEPLDDEVSLVVVPVKNGLVAEKGLDENSTLTLLLMINSKGKVVSGNIVYYLPSDQKKHGALPENTLSNLLSGKDVALDGTYKMLTLSGRWLSQFGVKDKKLSSVGTVEKKKAASDNAGRTTECTAWYLITTIYWMDGSVTRTEEYLGTTCGDNCGGNSGYATVCGVEPEESGGGSGPDIIYGEEDASATDSEPTPSASLTGAMDLNAGPKTVRHQAHVTYTYDVKTKVFTSITGGQPYPVPVSQVFTDDNGNPATLFNSVRSVTFTTTPVSYNSRYIHWSFVAVYTYVFTTGPFVLSRNAYIAKVITAT
jgi:hypothetical protein